MGEYSDGFDPYFDDGSDGLLIIWLKQTALSHTVLEEIDPVEIATIVGSIGGAWGEPKA